jgi:hypothetical protein
MPEPTSRHEALYKRALDGIKEMFSDTSVPQEHTWRSLQSLRDEIDVMMEALEGDMNV